MTPKQLFAAGALVGILAVGGASIASAQDNGSSSTTTPDSSSQSTTPSQSTAPGQSTAPSQSNEDPNCPNMGQAPGSTGTTPSADATAV